MKYTPYSEAEIQSLNVMAEGIYTFEVIEVITTDKHGNELKDKNGIDMAKLKLLVWDDQNKERILFTFLSGDGNFAFKLRHFAVTLGMKDSYEDGTFNIHKTVGKSGTAHIVVKKGTMKLDGSGEMWADRNDVKDFVVLKTTDTAPIIDKPLAVPQSNELDDDIPF